MLLRSIRAWDRGERNGMTSEGAVLGKSHLVKDFLWKGSKKKAICLHVAVRFSYANIEDNKKLEKAF